MDREIGKWLVGSLAIALVSAAPLSCGREVPGITTTHDEARLAANKNVAISRDDAIVIVVLDGARWQEIFRGVDPDLARGDRALDGELALEDGLMPNLHRMVQARGVLLGAADDLVTATGPDYVSLPGYHEIFSGHSDRECQDNECAPISRLTIVDEIRRATGSPGDVAVFSSWEKIEGAAASAPDDIVMSVGRGHHHQRAFIDRDAQTSELLAHGDTQGPSPGENDFRRDAATAEIALAYLESHRPRFLFLGLGETDEYAHLGDYGAYLGALRAADGVLGNLEQTLLRMGERGERTTILVTTDHGRAESFRDHGGEWPESGRVWLAAVGRSVVRQRASAVMRSQTLADIAPTMRALLCMKPDDTLGAGHAIDAIVADRLSWCPPL